MTNHREYLLHELLEHTMDCDCAKSQHFFDEKRCRRKATIFNGIQSVVFLVTIATYVLIVSGVNQTGWFNLLGIGLAMCSTLLEVLSYMLKYSDDAMAHWKAAQMYSELYRKCQFFYSDHVDDSIEVWQAKLHDISEELSRISSLAPAVSEQSYKAWADYGYNKKYPVHKAVQDLKTEDIAAVIEVIKRELEGYKIEIYLFGSYFTNMYYDDVDIAVVLHEEESTLPLLEKMKQIEKSYSVRGIDLDITIITEADIVANRCTQFIRNVCSGRRYYKSPEVKKCITEYDGVLVDYSEMVTYFTEKAEAAQGEYRGFVSNAFYMYYHALTAVLSKNDIPWYGERSLISECELLEHENGKLLDLGVSQEEFASLLLHARLFMDKKNTAYVTADMDVSSFDTLKAYFADDKKVVGKILQHTGGS